MLVPFDAPTITTPVTFRQSATDADNHVRDRTSRRRTCRIRSSCRGICRWSAACASTASTCSITTTATATRSAAPTTWSRRARASSSSRSPPLSLYGSYSVSYLPELRRSVLVADRRSPSRSKPEKFTNYEVGAKWDVRPRLSLTTAVYRLDRTNTRSTDPNDPDAHRPDRQPAHQRLRGRRERAASRRPGASPAATPTRTRSSPAPRRRPRRARRSARCRTTRSRSGTTTRSTPRVGGRRSASLYRTRHVRGDRQHRDAARLHARRRRGVRHADASVCGCRRTSRTCSTSGTTSTPTATRTSRPAVRGRFASR